MSSRDLAGRLLRWSPGAVLVALLALGCASSPPDREEVRRHMFATFWRMGSIPDRLVVGDLEGVRMPARWLGEQIEAEPMMGDPDRTERMRELAGRVVDAATVEDAAMAVTRLAAECGDCHEENQGGPVYGDVSPIPVGSRLETHMLRHIWASSRLWEGLVAADATHWDRGARVLTEDPLRFFENLEGDRSVPERARRIHELGERALETSDRFARAEVYGELITTCAGCHEAMGVPR
ncbi:MAG: hypothetical protein PVI57_17645 [Gemmatimonadota bacterium]|jgi:hypothetical protein